MIRNEKTKYIPLLILFSLILSVFLLSCKSDSPVSAGSQNASVSVMSQISGQDNTIVIASVKFLVEFIKLEQERGHDLIKLLKKYDNNTK